jgi:hypothetical protein
VKYNSPEFEDDEISNARVWLERVRQPDVQRALGTILQTIDKAVAERGPVCWSSGRCCRFDWFGHKLYTTGLEAARAWIMMRNAPTPVRERSLSVLQTAPADCRFHVDNRCTARDARPAGCRVFFCENGTEAWQQDVYETAMTCLKTLHEQAGAPYRFAEWRMMLRLMDAAGAMSDAGQ